MNNKQHTVGILGTGSYIPDKVLTNSDLEKMVDTTDEWIVSRTGIRTRRIADEKMATSDLATKAALEAIKDADISAEEIDLIIVATVTPDMNFPSTACIVQKNIGAKNAAAFDLEAGCSGFIYGLTVGKQFISNGIYKWVLVIGAETLSKIVDWSDRNTCVLFGDGGGAAVLGPTEEGMGILSVYIGADGEGGDFLTMPAGGSKNPASLATIEEQLHCIKMEGNEVFRFATRIMNNASQKALELSGHSLEDINYLVPHQANLRIIEAAAKKLNLPMNKVHVNLDRLGNMSAASIPVALDEAVKQGRINKGDLVAIVGFGAGLTWGASILRWNK
jgi:3-oxoacyl-[acyl-carrier-protein] synthase-3